jgi:hypothetical protein
MVQFNSRGLPLQDARLAGRPCSAKLRVRAKAVRVFGRTIHV